MTFSDSILSYLLARRGQVVKSWVVLSEVTDEILGHPRTHVPLKIRRQKRLELWDTLKTLIKQGEVTCYRPNGVRINEAVAEFRSSQRHK